METFAAAISICFLITTTTFTITIWRRHRASRQDRRKLAIRMRDLWSREHDRTD